MNAERLEQIRTEWTLWEAGAWPSSRILVDFEGYVPELLELVDQLAELVDQLAAELEQHADTIERLTGERDRARDTAIRAGAFD